MKEEELKDLEKKLWEAADKMRGAVPVSDYKFIILGLIFLKYISDAFEEKHKKLELQLKKLDTEQEAINTEMEAVKKVIDKNIENTFKSFA